MFDSEKFERKYKKKKIRNKMWKKEKNEKNI